MSRPIPKQGDLDMGSAFDAEMARLQHLLRPGEQPLPAEAVIALAHSDLLRLMLENRKLDMRLREAEAVPRALYGSDNGIGPTGNHPLPSACVTAAARAIFEVLERSKARRSEEFDRLGSGVDLYLRCARAAFESAKGAFTLALPTTIALREIEVIRANAERDAAVERFTAVTTALVAACACRSAVEA